MRTIVALAFLTVLLTGCGHTRQLNATLEALQGRDEEAAVDKYGPPAQAYETSGKRYLVFVKNKDVVVPPMPGYTSVDRVGRTTIVSTNAGTPAYTVGYWCKLTLALSKETRLIESSRWEGNWCRAFR